MRKIIVKESNWNKTGLVNAIELCHSMKDKNEPINIIEFGVYTGDSCRLMSEMLKNRPKFILGVDSFQGLPEESEGIDRFEHYKKGGFGDVFTKTCAYGDAVLLKRWFKDLTMKDIEPYNIKKFDIVHMDCDLHVSTIDAYQFLLANNLIGINTIIVYDEFKSTKNLYAGGECLAHKETAEKYNIHFEEFFRNMYWDELNQLEFWQNNFIIHSIGQKSEIGLITIENNR
jgi:hypothetical protein